MGESKPGSAFEREFWAKVLSLAQPGWSLRLLDGADGTGISTADVHMYAADASTGFLFVGACRGSDVKASLEQVRQFPASFLQEVVEAAGSALRFVATGELALEGDTERALLTALLLSYTQTATYKVATSNGANVKGHWLYLLYRLKSGDSFLRPLGLMPPPGHPESSLLPPMVVKAAVQNAIHLDTTSPGSSVYQAIRAGGGLAKAG